MENNQGAIDAQSLLGGQGPNIVERWRRRLRSPGGIDEESLLALKPIFDSANLQEGYQITSGVWFAGNGTTVGNPVSRCVVRSSNTEVYPTGTIWLEVLCRQIQASEPLVDGIRLLNLALAGRVRMEPILLSEHEDHLIVDSTDSQTGYFLHDHDEMPMGRLGRHECGGIIELIPLSRGYRQLVCDSCYLPNARIALNVCTFADLRVHFRGLWA